MSELAISLVEDPEGTDTPDLYRTEQPVQPGTVFSYAFMIWDHDKGSVWDIENFSQARELTVPECNRTEWVCTAHMHQRLASLRPVVTGDAIHEGTDSLTGSDEF
eukprot:Protomagalhaensia_wolfi_Nauph_80__4008@NODE_4068_length_646_cov_291_387150_g3225_i0_p1_GENE_NODE_4068_length_646_cov_291_387150_g3225_i0NODE_4068_length_646_cov_291_387150_g3225_i0_p1_ORF_typecomplete_len105_score10_06CBM_20/PF00686_19/0_013_NODE_4068_length_646_cov_291_387150_g3225_i027341